MQQAAWQIENLLHEKSQQAAGPFLPGLAWERSYIARTSPADSLTGTVVINAMGTLLCGAKARSGAGLEARRQHVEFVGRGFCLFQRNNLNGTTDERDEKDGDLEIIDCRLRASKGSVVIDQWSGGGSFQKNEVGTSEDRMGVLRQSEACSPLRTS